MSTRTFHCALFSAAMLVIHSNQVQAVPTQVVHINTPACDTLFIPTNVDEIGHMTEFPGTDEDLLPANLGQTSLVPCPQTHLGMGNFLVDIRNLTGKEWQEVWYIADQETNVTNFDGEANAAGFAPTTEAFRIDNMVSDPGGSHHPLIFESITPDGIWEIGEAWQFVLQDYTNTLGLPPHAITSIGVGSASSIPTMVTDAAGNPLFSSGSIVAVEVPEPATCLLMVIGLGTLTLRRR